MGLCRYAFRRTKPNVGTHCSWPLYPQLARQELSRGTVHHLVPHVPAARSQHRYCRRTLTCVRNRSKGDCKVCFYPHHDSGWTIANMNILARPLLASGSHLGHVMPNSSVVRSLPVIDVDPNALLTHCSLERLHRRRSYSCSCIPDLGSPHHETSEMGSFHPARIQYSGNGRSRLANS